MNNNFWACMIIAAIHTTAEGFNHRIMFAISILAAFTFLWIERKK